MLLAIVNIQVQFNLVKLQKFRIFSLFCAGNKLDCFLHNEYHMTVPVQCCMIDWAVTNGCPYFIP